MNAPFRNSNDDYFIKGVTMKKITLCLFATILMSNVVFAEVKPAGTIVPYLCAYETNKGSLERFISTFCLSTAVGSGNQYLVFSMPSAYVPMQYRAVAPKLQRIHVRLQKVASKAAQTRYQGFAVINNREVRVAVDVQFAGNGEQIGMISVNGKRMTQGYVRMETVYTTQGL